MPSGVTKTQFYLDMYPRGEKMDDGKLMTVQSVHSLTYRYTHGFDARAQSMHCERCHEPETFCQPCHQNGYDGNGARIKVWLSSLSTALTTAPSTTRFECE